MPMNQLPVAGRQLSVKATAKSLTAEDAEASRRTQRLHFRNQNRTKESKAFHIPRLRSGRAPDAEEDSMKRLPPTSPEQREPSHNQHCCCSFLPMSNSEVGSLIFLLLVFVASSHL